MIDKKDEKIIKTSATKLDLRQLAYFLAAVEEGSISAAAATLGIAPATLSEGLSTLEARIGSRLAVRSRRGLSLTPSGKVLANGGGAIIEAAQALVNEALNASDELTGIVSLALPPSLSVLIGVPLVETMRTELPNIRLRLSEGLSGNIIQWVDGGTIDCGFIYKAPDPLRYAARPVFEEELFLIGASDFLPAAAKVGKIPTIALQALSDLPLVLPSTKHNARNIVDGIAKENGLSLKILCELDSYTQIIEMVSRASAYTFLPRAAVLAPLARGDLLLIRIADAAVMRTCYFVQLRENKSNRAVNLLGEKIEAILREMDRRYGLSIRFVTEEPPEYHPYQG